VSASGSGKREYTAAGMGRLLWPLAVLAAFGAGWAVAGVAGKTLVTREAAPEVERLRQQVVTLQARLPVREEVAEAPASAPRARAGATPAPRVSAEGERNLTAAMREEQLLNDIRTRSVSQPDRVTTRSGPGSTPTIESALDRFYKYLETTKGAEGRERWQRARELVEELRGMGDVAGKALMQALAASHDSDERRAAARLLGALQVPQAVPLLKEIIERDDDLLLRRAAASGLRQLQTPESLPVLERILANGADDRLVRLSAAYGLAESGRPLGVNGLAQIFQESVIDGRGREMAFRALTSLKDERPLPFMRQVVASDAEPAYRLRAIQYLTAHGDRQALATLHVLMQSPTEQASIRDAAANAYRALSGR
jgi:HEAT repeat protein